MMKKQLQELIEKMNADWEKERNELQSENKALLEKVNELINFIYTSKLKLAKQDKVDILWYLSLIILNVMPIFIV